MGVSYRRLGGALGALGVLSIGCVNACAAHTTLRLYIRSTDEVKYLQVKRQGTCEVEITSLRPWVRTLLFIADCKIMQVLGELK